MNYTNTRILDLVNRVIEHDKLFPMMQGAHCITAIRDLINTHEQIMTHRVKRKGKMMIKVVESGMDCDCVKYSGRVHTCEATVKAFEELHDRIAEWADGPFSLSIVPWSQKITYTSRDLALEAYENGHPHHITFDGE